LPYNGNSVSGRPLIAANVVEDDPKEQNYRAQEEATLLNRFFRILECVPGLQFWRAALGLLGAYLKTGMRAASPDEQEVQDGEGEEAA
jgi:hypothetical protein